MNKNPLFVLLASLIVGACAQTGMQPGAPPGMMNCPKIDLPEQCIPLSGVPPRITITANAVPPDARPRNACAQPGMTIEFEVAPRHFSKTVAIIPKDPADTWLLASKPAGSDTFTITVPEDVDRYKDYDYFIFTGDGRCTDPRIRVD